MYRGPIIDTDVHYMRQSDAEWLPYLAGEWRDLLQLPGGRVAGHRGSVSTVVESPDGLYRLDAYPEGGILPGSDYDLLREQYLDHFDIRVALLTQVAGPSSPNGELVTAMCRAWNDWMADTWLARGDDRLFATLFVPTHDPLAGAAEIKRVGAGNERFAGAHIFHAVGRALGHSAFDPVYAAMCDADLPLFIHTGTGEYFGDAPPLSGGAVPSYRLETFATLHHPLVHHLTSMVVHGTFEKFPSLRIVVVEEGVSWLGWLIASLDARYELMRRESPWVRRRPSEYLCDRLAISTQPIEASLDDRHRLVDFLGTFDGIENMLCFSSDYPHWDNDEPTFVASILPNEWHDKVFYGNARRLLRLPSWVPLEPTRLSPAV